MRKYWCFICFAGQLAYKSEPYDHEWFWKPNPNQASIKEKSRTHSSRELELERRALEEGGAVVIAASYKAVRTLLPYIHAVDDFGVASQIPDCGAAVPEEDGSKPRERAELL